MMTDDERLDWPAGWIFIEGGSWHVHPNVDTTQYERGDLGRKVTLTEPAVCGATGDIVLDHQRLDLVPHEPQCETCLAMMEDLVYHALRMMRVAGRTVGDGYSTSLTSPSEISPLATAYRTGERAVPSLDSIQAALDAVAHATAHQRPARYTGQDGTLTMTDANGAGIQVRLADWDITVKHDPDPRAFQTLAWKWGPPKP